MIDVAANNAVYYYHFDGLGSVVALSDSNGVTVQTYEYSVYDQVAAGKNRDSHEWHEVSDKH